MSLEKVEVGQMYTNKKNKRDYFVVSIGLHTELEEVTVHYKPMYKGSPYTDFYRPLWLFKEKFEE